MDSVVKIVTNTVIGNSQQVWFEKLVTKMREPSYKPKYVFTGDIWGYVNQYKIQYNSGLEFQNLKLIQKFQHPSWITQILIDENRNNLIVCGNNGIIQTWELDTSNKRREDIKIANVIECATWYHQKDKKFLIATTFENVIVLDWDTKEIVKTIQAHPDHINCLLVDEDKKELLTCSDDKTSKLWCLDTFDCKHVFECNSQVKRACFMDRSKTLFATENCRLDIKIWNKETRECLYKLLKEGVCYYEHLIYSLDLKLLISHGGTTLNVWDFIVLDGEKVRLKLKFQTTACMSAFYAGTHGPMLFFDGKNETRILASDSNDNLILIDLLHQKIVWKLGESDIFSPSTISSMLIQ